MRAAVVFAPLLFGAVLMGCATPAPERPPVPAASVLQPGRGPVRTGAGVLAAQGFEPFRGRRVGLIVNHTAVVDTAHLADLVARADGVTLAALFGPEHGLRGTADAGEQVDDGRDDRTGAPVYSLYGDTRKPTPAMLRDVDVLVFDIQDVGARFYTYISTMGLAMQAAAEAGLPFVVLDRPNPLGGTRAEGFVMEPDHVSFVGQYPIPITHGLTVGELAAMIKGERMLPGLEQLDLQVVPMEGWRRTMLWPETGLPWIPTSPNVPDFETALVYAGTCLFEATSASEGRGTETPFLLVGAPWADGRALADTLNARALPGVRFEPAGFTPRSIPGMSANPKLSGTPLQGLRLVVTDAAAYRPVETGIHALDAFYRQAPASERPRFFDPEWLAKLGGTERLHALFTRGARPADILAAWQPDADAFLQRRARYLLYD